MRTTTLLVTLFLITTTTGCSMASRMKSGYADIANLDGGKKEVVFYSGFLTDRQTLRDSWDAAAKKECGGAYSKVSGPTVGSYGGMDKLVGVIRCK